MGTTLFTLASLVIPAVACAAGGSPKGGTYGKGPAPMAGKRLNNFVRELLDLDSPKPQVYPFTIHSPAWIFVRTMEGKAGVQLKLDQVAEPVISYGAGQTGTREAMRYLKAGQHQLKLLGSGVGRLQVRKVPEIRYCSYQYDPWVIAYGPYDWQFLERHILPHVNTVVGQSDEDQRPQANAWRAQAKRWIVEVMAPGLRPRKALSIEETVRQLTEDFRRGPWVDGILIDEYYPSLKFLFQPTIEAIKRIKADPLFSGKEIAPYLAGDPMKLADFIKGAAKLGCKFAIERYNCDNPPKNKPGITSRAG